VETKNEVQRNKRLRGASGIHRQIYVSVWTSSLWRKSRAGAAACSMRSACCWDHGRHLLARTACFTQISLSRDYLPTGQRLITSCWELK
jgi:hypothetical protein